MGTPFKYLKSLGKQVDEAVNRATYQSFTNIVDFAIEQQVHAVLITGDIYDSRKTLIWKHRCVLPMNANALVSIRFPYF
mgnify:CR=1 FL=1